ncbi:MAG: hypothetical protein RI907_2248 [Pseudomonadota bacterium]
MQAFEWIIVLLAAAAALAEVARRVGAPYPTLLALGGAGLALLPNGPQWVLDPELALALFVAPVLLDAAYDTSLRELRANWRPVTGLVVAAVGTTVLAVALVCRWLVPDMPWAVAVALGAIVAPPDAAAATAVMRQVGLPHRVLNILEGESLLNDASSLLIYRLALMAMATGPLGFQEVAPVLGLTMFGSLAAGVALGWVLRPMLAYPRHVPTSLALQFATTFGVWITAERFGLSGILTMVACAMTLARGGGPRIPAHMRVPILSAWETVVFVLNALSFVLIGLQLRPIWTRFATNDQRWQALGVAAAVLAVVIVSRFAWVMGYGAVTQRCSPALTGRTWATRLVVSWSGMRGIVTLAAAFALPERLPGGAPFPFRDLVVLCAFAVVLGTLVLQGLSLRPLIRRLAVAEADPVADDIRRGRVQVYQALIDALPGDASAGTDRLRRHYQNAMAVNQQTRSERTSEQLDAETHLRAIAVAREAAITMRNEARIGEHAYRQLIRELDWAELAADSASPLPQTSV